MIFHLTCALDALNLDVTFTYFPVINVPASVRVCTCLAMAFMFVLSRTPSDSFLYNQAKAPKRCKLLVWNTVTL